MKKPVLIVLGAVLGLLGLGALFLGGVGLVVFGTDGVVSTDTHRVEGIGRAIVSKRTEVLGSIADATGGGVHLRIDAVSTTGKEVFLGVGPTPAVEEWLRGVGGTEMEVLRFAPFDATLRTVAGESSPADPRRMSFWSASSVGSEVSIDWEADQGEYRVVLINIDRSEGVGADGRLAIELPYVVTIGVTCVVVGLGLAVLGVLLFVIGMRMPSRSRVSSPSGLPPGSPLPPPRIG